MSDLKQLLDQFRARHQRALITRTSVQAILNVIIGGLIALRLQATHQPLAWRIAVPALWIGATLSLLAWRLRQQWLTTQGAAAQLDDALGLEQRLVTATEFAGRAEQSALYPLLLDDVASRYHAGDARTPKRFDRISAALVAVLAVLLLWPLPARAPLTQLAQVPPAAQPPKPPEPPPVQPPPPQEQQQQQNQQQQKQQQQNQQQQKEQQQPSSSSKNDRSQSKAENQERSKNAQQSTQSSQQSVGSRQQAADSKPQSGQGGQQQSPVGQQQGQGGGQQSAQQSQASTKGQQGQQQAGQQNQSGGQKSGQGASAQQMMAQQAQSTAGQPGASGANSEALRGEIQQLLKQMSGELKQLEAQLADAKDQPNPTAGTGTDPSLYEKGATPPSAPTASGSLPIAVGTDTAPTTNNRRAAGVGDATSRAATAAPTAPVQDVQLTDTPRPETSSTRQAIPPEYQPVFDRLQQPSNATGDTTR